MKKKRQHLYKKYSSASKKNKKTKIFYLKYLIVFFGALSFLSFMLYYALNCDILKKISTQFYSKTIFNQFTIKHIVIPDLIHIPQNVVMDSIGFNVGDSIFSADIVFAQNALKAIPWASAVAIKRVGLDTIEISIDEEVPEAIFSYLGKNWFVNKDGKILQECHLGQSDGLINIAGEDANLYYIDIMRLLIHHEKWYHKIIKMEFIDKRRWDIVFNNNIVVKLPATNVEDALKIIDEHFNIKNSLKYQCIIDLRLIPDKIYIKEMK